MFYTLRIWPFEITTLPFFFDFEWASKIQKIESTFELASKLLFEITITHRQPIDIFRHWAGCKNLVDCESTIRFAFGLSLCEAYQYFIDFERL